MEGIRQEKEVLGMRGSNGCHRRSWLGVWLVVIATCSLVGCSTLKPALITGAATATAVGVTSALVPGAIAPAIAGGVTAVTASALTAAPTVQAAEINAETVVHHAPDNFFTLLGKLIKMGGIATILIILVPMVFSWLLPGPIQFKGRKKK
jgi:hypothetical protein